MRLMPINASGLQSKLLRQQDKLFKPPAWVNFRSRSLGAMASAKAEKPAGPQTLFGQARKESPKASSEGTQKGAPSKSAPKKTEQKPREPKKKGKGGKPAAKK